MDIDKCVICGEPVKYYEPEYCCDGNDCGCMGSPVEPPVCHNENCQKEIFGPSGSVCAGQLRKAKTIQ